MMRKSYSKQTIAVLFGGRSVEHEISILTGLQVIHAFDKTRFNVLPVYINEQGHWWTGKELFNKDFYKDINYRKLKKFKKHEIDVYFPCFHGDCGENGSFQGLFEILDKPYAGPGVLAAAVGMSKAATKQICIANKIPVLPYVLFSKDNWNIGDAKRLQFPLFVKPNNLGSSIGVSSAKDERQLQIAIAGAFIFDTQVIIEPQIRNLLEINCAVFNNQVSELEEPKKDQDILSFEQKYLKGSKTKGMLSMQRIIDPKSITQEQKHEIANYAKKIYKALDGSGVWRIDFIINKNNNQIYLNEINTIPGSLAYYLWEPKNISFTALLTKLVDSAIQRYARKKQPRRAIQKRIFT